MKRPHAPPLWRLALLLAALALMPPGTARADDEDDGAYGRTPEELAPWRGAGEPHHRFFGEPPTFRGPGAGAPEPPGLSDVALGVVLPLGGADAALGRSMEHGVALALEEANARGGFRGRLPYRAVTRDEDLPWGGGANLVVDLAWEQRVWAIVGALEDSVSHVMARVLLKVEVPVVNTGGSDPTLTEHAIPWLLRIRPDDRRIGYRLAERVFRGDGRTRVAVFRSNDRYGRTGTAEFVDAARRLGAPVPMVVRFEDHDRTFDLQVAHLRALAPDSILLWGRAAAAGRALAALREGGVDVPVYGCDRLVDPAFLEAAGAAAEGAVLAAPFDPDRDDAAWAAFRARFQERFGHPADAVAAYAYDGTRYLVACVEEAGLNRVRIREALFAHRRWEGVTGTVRFDTTQNNVQDVVLGEVRGGAFRVPPPFRAAVGLVGDADAEVTRALERGLRLALETGRAGDPVVTVHVEQETSGWSNAAPAAVRLAARPEVLALVTPPDRRVAHLVAQVGTRTQVPVLTTSAAPTVGATGSSWVAPFPETAAPGGAERLWRERHGGVMPPAAAAAWSAGRALLRALRAGVRDRAGVRRVLQAAVDPVR